jgi:hypothetical protein
MVPDWALVAAGDPLPGTLADTLRGLSAVSPPPQAAKSKSAAEHRETLRSESIDFIVWLP